MVKKLDIKPDSFSTLWIGESLPVVQQICLSSYIYHNQKINFYTYSEVKNVPDGVTILDAESILPKKDIFMLFNSYAIFSDYFRYILLSKKDTVWVDADHMSLSKNWGTEDSEYFYGIQRYVNNANEINNGVLKYPKDSRLAKSLVLECQKILAKGEKMVWGETGPILLTKLVNDLGLNRFAINKNRIYPVSWETRDINPDLNQLVISDFIKKNSLPLMIKLLHKNNSFSLTFWNNVFKEIIQKSPAEDGSFLDYAYKKYVLRPKR